MRIRLMVVLRCVGCKSLVSNLRCGLSYTAETPSESVEVNKKLLPYWDAGECAMQRGFGVGRVRRRGRVGISDCRDRGTWTHMYSVLILFTVLLR